MALSTRLRIGSEGDQNTETRTRKGGDLWGSVRRSPEICRKDEPNRWNSSIPENHVSPPGPVRVGVQSSRFSTRTSRTRVINRKETEVGSSRPV